MKKIIDKYFHLICIGVFIIIISFIVINSYYDSKEILKNPKYTAATVISDWHHKDTNGIGYDYEYFVNKKRYSATINLDLEKKEKYLIIFDSLQPQKHTLLNIYKIDKSLSIPINGWQFDKVPIKIDTTKIKDIVLGSE